MMSLQQIRRDIEGLKESTKARHLQVLLSCNAEDLTDSELTKLLMEVPIRQLPTSVLLTIHNRVHGSNFKCLQDLPAGFFEKMRNEYLESLSETEKKNFLEFRGIEGENKKGVKEK
jgi:hypothetical protein